MPTRVIYVFRLAMLVTVSTLTFASHATTDMTQQNPVDVLPNFILDEDQAWNGLSVAMNNKIVECADKNIHEVIRT